MDRLLNRGATNWRAFSATLDPKMNSNSSEKSCAVVAYVNPLPVPRISLRTLSHVRREAVKVYREMRSGQLPADQGTRLLYGLQTIGKLIERTDLEDRLTRLEKAGG